MAISTHALREEGDINRPPRRSRGQISTHALREEGDISDHEQCMGNQNFYPRPPRGGRPYASASADAAGGISTHALREEGD